MRPHIDLPRGVHALRVDRLERPLHLHAGMAVQDVDAAEGFERAGDEPLELRVVSDVRLDGERAPAGFCDTSCRLLARRCIAIRHDHRRAFARHDLGPGPPDPRSGPGDDGNAVLEDHRPASAPAPRRFPARIELSIP